MRQKQIQGLDSLAVVDRKGNIFVNTHASARPEQWAYVIAHCLLHLAFGHFDQDNIPDADSDMEFNRALWNKACDIYIATFLADIDFGDPIGADPTKEFSIKLNDEQKIYRHLLYIGDDGSGQEYGTNGEQPDMVGLDRPVVYKPGEKNPFMAAFAFHLAVAAHEAVSEVSEEKKDINKASPAWKAAQWFLSHYPLLGGLASGFRLVEDYEICRRNEIQIAAVNAYAGEIYINPTAGLDEEEWKFVLAHEYLHAGLDHAGRCQGRDRFLNCSPSSRQ